MKKILWFLGLAALSALAGFYAVTWYGTQQVLAELKSGLSERGVLAWEETDADLDGSVTIRGLNLTLFGLSQPIRIGSVTFEAGSPQALLTWLLQPEAGWPDGARLSINQARHIVQPEMTKAWLSTAAPGVRQWPKPWQLRECGAVRPLGGRDLLALGVHTLELDAEFEWTTGPGGTPTLTGEIGGGELGSVDFAVRSAALPRSVAELQDSKKSWPLQWQTLDLVLRDGGFMRRVAAYCAQNDHADPATWASAATTKFQDELKAWGVNPGQQLRALYQRWLHQGGSVTLTLPATAETGIDGLASLVDYLGRDGRQVQYNGQQVPDVTLSLDSEQFAVRANPVIPDTGPAPMPGAAAPQADSVHTAEWLDTPLQAAGQWLQRPVRLTLASGHTLGDSIEGRLSAINTQTLTVVRNLKGGEFAAPVDRAAVISFRVWRRSDEKPVLPVEPEALSAPAAHNDSAVPQPDTGLLTGNGEPIF